MSWKDNVVRLDLFFFFFLFFFFLFGTSSSSSLLILISIKMIFFSFRCVWFPGKFDGKKKRKKKSKTNVVWATRASEKLLWWAIRCFSMLFSAWAWAYLICRYPWIVIYYIILNFFLNFLYFYPFPFLIFYFFYCWFVVMCEVWEMMPRFKQLIRGDSYAAFLGVFFFFLGLWFTFLLTNISMGI